METQRPNNPGAADPSGRTSQVTGFGKGRPTPEKRQMPFARHVSIAMLIGSGGTSVEAKDALVVAFDGWKRDASATRYKVLELKFEWVTETKVSLAIIYSE
jgi:hypothetical protein